MLIPTIQDVQDQLLRHRRLQRRIAGTAAANQMGVRYEIFSVAGPSSFYCTAPTLKHALKLAEAEAWDQVGTVVSIWSPLRAHVYQAVVQDGRYRVLHGAADRLARFDTPEALVDELLRYCSTTQNLREQRLLVERNQANLMANGTYDGQVAFKAFRPVADAAIDQYAQQYGTAQQEQFPHDICQMMAEQMVRLFEQTRREEPERFVEQYVEPQLEQSPSGQRTIQLGDGPDDGRTIVININAATE